MISIAMTSYNGEKYISSQLDSIIGQTVKDFELFVCDDCSQDNTYSILKGYEKKDSRIHAFQNISNLGFAKNFEHAIQLCKGDYVALCDQDDIWRPNHLEILLNGIKNKDASVGNSQIMDGTGTLKENLLSDGDGYFVDGNDNDKMFRVLFYGNPFQGTSAMYTRELLEKALPIPAGVEYHDAWFAVCALASKGINYTFETITNYRIHGNNASGNHKTSFIDRLKITLKRNGFKTDRLIFCEELLERFPGANEDIKDIIYKAKDFFEARKAGNKIKVLGYSIKYYKKIYATNSLKYLFPRCLRILIKG